MAIRRQELNNGAVCFTADCLAGVPHGFSSRLGGVSLPPYDAMNLSFSRGDDPDRAAENVRRFCGGLGLPLWPVSARQVHGDAVLRVTEADVPAEPGIPTLQGDALMTDVPGVTLAVYTADCIPILLYDPVRRAAAAVHAGWRGTANGIAERAVERMAAAYGTRPADLRAAIGPGIGPCCFETHADVPEAMRASLGQAAEAFIRPAEAEGKYFVDLPGINRFRLERLGVPAAQIDGTALCTAGDPALFWSHRRHGATRGSLAAMIAIPREAAL